MGAIVACDMLTRIGDMRRNSVNPFERSLLWTPISIAEIFAGARKSERERLETLFQIIEMLPISEAIGKKAGHYLQKYSKSHSLELGDALIAASACITNLSLWTINKKH